MLDKASSAAERPDMTAMRLLHQAFRREFAALAQEASRPHDAARRSALEDQLGLMLRILHHHHTGEDTLMWPVVRQRAPESSAVLAVMEADHEELDPLIQRAGDTSLPLAERAATLSQLSDLLAAHLDREEREAFPLLERAFTAAEYTALDKVLMKMAGRDLPMLAGAVMWHATPEERSRLLAATPRIVGIMWRLSWRRTYARRAARTYGDAAGREAGSEGDAGRRRPMISPPGPGR